MQAMKTSLFMDKFCALFLNTVLLAAMPAAALATILQAF
ncbi:hypothetical protein FHS64_000706 [Brevundimonas terrae]|nr:hypothetical protein [Brevundimonas terrae]